MKIIYFIIPILALINVIQSYHIIVLEKRVKFTHESYWLMWREARACQFATKEQEKK